ncbi:barstar family protein [Pseudofulvimonas gallinarii]|uniref:barstar family protein n=2 Tax=Pseudofulvimonas gallinarii TaxID=634155 RepID=UPI0035EFE92F
MTFGEWTAWLRQHGEAGVFFIEPGERPDLFAAARGLDFATVRLDLADCRRSDDLFARMAAVFRFPEWFGDNWDALADCLADLSWWLARGYVLVIGNSGAFRRPIRRRGGCCWTCWPTPPTAGATPPCRSGVSSPTRPRTMPDRLLLATIRSPATIACGR